MIIGSLWAGEIEDDMNLQQGSLFKVPQFDFELPQARKMCALRNKKLREDLIFPPSSLTEGNLFILPISGGFDDVYFKYRGQMIVFTQGSYTEGDHDRIKAKDNSEIHKKALHDQWATIKAHIMRKKQPL